MWVEAILSKEDLAAVIGHMCPVTIALGDAADDDHYLKILNPKDVALVEGRGLRLTCEAEISWPVLGIDVPIRIETLTILLNLSLAPTLSEEVLAFKPELENVELSWIPNVFDAAMTEKINHQLSKKHVEFSWHFFETLSHVFDLTGLIRPPTALDMRVAWGRLRVTHEAMVMAVSFHTHVVRQEGPALASSVPAPYSSQMASSVPAHPASSIVPARTTLKPPSVSVPVPIAIAGGAALFGVAAYLAVGTTTRLLRYALVRA